MPGFVRSDEDEKKWSKAKSVAKEKGLSGDSMYAYANAVFHRMKGKKDLDESKYDLPDHKLKLYSQLDYSVNNLEEEEMWHVMKHILSEHPHFNVNLEEDEQYIVLEYLFDNYKNTICENNYNKIKDYLNAMVIPDAVHNHHDRKISYGVLDEDYISGGFGGMGSAEYGYGGVGYAGGRARRRGFGGPRNGGQMSRRATGNPFKVGSGGEEPIVVGIPDKKSTYKPWQVELTPDGQPVNRIKRSHNEQQIDSAWDSEIGAALMGLESMGLDLDELGEKSPEEIEDILLRKFKNLGMEAEQENLQESIYEEDDVHKKITTIFEDDEEQRELEEKIQRNTRIQDARDILSTKHQVHKAYEKNRDKSYVINQYGIEKLMRKYGYVYDDKAMKWIKKAKPLAGDPANKKFGSHPDEDSAVIVPQTDGDEETEISTHVEEPPESDDGEMSITSDESEDETPDKEDYNQFDNIDDPVRLEAKIKPLQARFILDLTLEDKNATKFSLTKDGSLVPEVRDDEVIEKMNNMKLDWDGDKDIWVDDTNTIPQQVFATGEDRQSLLARGYLAAMGEIAAIQFNSKHQMLFNADEVIRRMEQNKYVWDQEINKWKYNDKDLANTPAQDENVQQSLNESVLYEQNDQQIVKGKPAIDENDLEELQARYLYRLVQLNAIKNAPKEQRMDLDAIDFGTEQNPTLIEGGSKISGNRIIKLLSGKVKPANRRPEDEPQVPQIPDLEDKEPDQKRPSSIKESILKIFEVEEDDPEAVELSGEETEDPEEDVLKIQGEEEPEPQKEPEPQEDKSPYVLLSDADEIIPSVKYDWDDKLNIWTENGKIPKLIKDVGDNQQSFAGRAVLTILTEKPDFIEIEKTGEPIVDPKRVMRILDKNTNIYWDTKQNLWIEGEPVDPDELNPLEEQLKAYDEKILQRYNNGQGYDKSGMSPKLLNDLKNALIAEQIIGSGKYTEKEWYRMPENDKEAQHKAQRRRNKELASFKLKNIVQEKEFPVRERPEPRHTHHIEIRPRLQLASRIKKGLTDAMLNLGKKAFTGALTNLGKAIMTGMIVAAASQGYQGPYKFTPFEKGMSTAFKQYWGKKYQDYYTQMYSSRRQPMGLTPKSSARGTRGGGGKAG